MEAKPQSLKHPAPDSDTSPMMGCLKKLKTHNHNNNVELENDGVGDTCSIDINVDMVQTQAVGQRLEGQMEVSVQSAQTIDIEAPVVPKLARVARTDAENGNSGADHGQDLTESVARNQIMDDTDLDVKVMEHEQAETNCEEVAVTSTKIPCQITTCTAEFDTQLEVDVHYKARHLFTCSQCKRQMSTHYLLELHVLEFHDSFFAVQAERKPMYSCFEPKCNEKFADPDQRYAHCVSKHEWQKTFIQFHEFKSFICQLSSQHEIRQPKKHEIIEEDIKMDTEASATAAAINKDHSTPLEQTIKKDKQKVKPKGKVTQTKPAVHISFGRHVGKFIPNQVFAMHKPKKPAGANPANEVCSTEMSDLTDLKVALDVD